MLPLVHLLHMHGRNWPVPKMYPIPMMCKQKDRHLQYLHIAVLLDNETGFRMRMTGNCFFLVSFRDETRCQPRTHVSEEIRRAGSESRGCVPDDSESTGRGEMSRMWPADCGTRGCQVMRIHG